MGRTTQIPYDDTTLDAYLAEPDGAGPHPSVVVIHEWTGLDDHIQDLANRLASEGYLALAPDLYDGKLASDDAEAGELMDTYFAAAPPKVVAAYDAVRAFDHVGRVGCVGLSMGGMLALSFAINQDDLDASVVYYGLPESYLGQFDSVRSPMLGLFGELDGWVPTEQVNQLDKELEAAGVQREMVIYPGADHDFLNDRGATYQAEAAKDAWGRTLTFLGEHLR